MHLCVPFLRRLLRRLPPSVSSLSSASFLAESEELSQLIWRLSAVATRLDARLSGVFLADGVGLSNRFESGVKLLESPLVPRLTLVNPELTAVKPPELIAVKPPAGAGGASAIGVSRSTSFLTPLMVDCRISDAWRAGESPLPLAGVLTVERLIGVWAGLGVKGPPYSCSSC